MVLKIFGYLGMAIVVGLLIQTMVTTLYLSKIDTGLTTSLQTTTQLAGIEQAVIDKNKSLSDIVSTSKQMDQQISTALSSTKQIQGNIHTIDSLNGSTLTANHNTVSYGNQSGATLGLIANNMQQLKQSIAALLASITKLDGWAKQDRNDISQMKQATDEMNQKVPGVGK